MRSFFRVIAATLGVVASALSLVVSPARAAWPLGPYDYLPLTDAGGAYSNLTQSVPDGAGGALVSWIDDRTGAGQLYATRVLTDGNVAPGWPSGGLRIAPTGSVQSWLEMISDGAGGAYLTWLDYRHGTNPEVYATRVTGIGVIASGWSATGRRVTTTPEAEVAPRLAGDFAGGCFVAWTHALTVSDWDVYATRLNSTGATHPEFAPGIRTVCYANGIQELSSIAPDGAGNLLLSWYDDRFDPNGDVYVQKMSGTGAVFWVADGVNPGSTALTEVASRVFPIAGGGLGYVARVWAEDFSHSWIERVRVAPDGFTAVGAPLGPTGSASSPVAIPDGHDGAWVAFTTVTDSLFVQHLGPSAAPTFPGAGVHVSTGFELGNVATMALDGAGGVYVTWEDQRNGPVNPYATRVSGFGTLLYPMGGVPIATTGANAFWPAIVNDERGGAVVAWQDGRLNTWPTPSYRIFANRLDPYGYVGEYEPRITSVRDVAGDQGGAVKVSWDRSPFDASPVTLIGQYRMWRSVPTTLAAARVARGARRIAPGEPLPVGPGPVFTSTIRNGIETAWELAGTQVPSWLPSYSLTVPTTTDSMPGSNPWTLYMVQALSVSMTQLWSSEPDSGYSVDNIAPPMPAPFTGAYASGTVTLAWGASGASDFSHFRLYRGSSTSFVPGPGNLVTELTSTSFTDAAGSPHYYKLVAVDIHGNASAPAFVMPSGMVGVEDDAPRFELALAGARPNPVRGGASVHFTLPHAMHARLDVLDVAGRRVASLADGTLEAGEHALAWPGRDARGRGLPAGIYLVRLEAIGRALTRRVAVIE